MGFMLDHRSSAPPHRLLAPLYTTGRSEDMWVWPWRSWIHEDPRRSAITLPPLCHVSGVIMLRGPSLIVRWGRAGLDSLLDAFINATAFFDLPDPDVNVHNS
jgi:hypothetical protein